MTPQKLKRLRRRIAELRGRGGIKSSEMEALAKACDRKPRAGSHQTWVRKDGTGPALPIPHHTTDLNKYTADGMLDVLEDDLDHIAQALNAQHEGNGHGQR